MNTNEINKNKYILEDLIEAALLDSVEWITAQCGGKPQEPDYVAALSTRFTERLFNVLRAIFPGNVFSVTGVFCHQKPTVDISTAKNPELGDLLLVYVDRDSNGEKVINSLLLQAKISNSSVMKVSNTDLHQLKLYKEWPKFTYHRADALNGEQRDIQPKTINDGAQYLLIDNNPHTNGLLGGAGTFPMGCAIPDRILKLDESFACEIVRFLKFKAGRVIDNDYHTTKDDWSRMIWELLFIAADKFSKRKNAHLSSFPREKEFVNLSTEGFRESLIENVEFLQANSNYLEENGGVSVILIESGNEQRNFES